MEEIVNLIGEQSHLIKEPAIELKKVTEICSALADRVIQLEMDMKNVLENTGSLKG